MPELTQLSSATLFPLVVQEPVVFGVTQGAGLEISFATAQTPTGFGEWC